MRKFLAQFLNNEEIDRIEAAYKEKNSDATGLPVYISKSRLDEEISKRKNAEEKTAQAIKDAEDKYKDIPNDWSKQLEDAKNALTTQKAEYEAQLASAKKEADVAAAIYENGGRNPKAIRALIDAEKPIQDELARVRKSDPYLFKESFIGGKGTGKDGEDGDGGAGGAGELSLEKMYAAVGLVPPESGK